MLCFLKTYVKRIIYRKKNKDNFTEIKRNIDINNVNVGKGTYGTLDILTYKGKNSKLYIGNYCSIANDVVFLMGGEHQYKNLLTYPIKAKYLNTCEAQTKGDIIIKDDVWIGYGSTVLSGVTIGQGAIIGAKSVVSKDIPPYAIYAGGKIIKYRFSESIIKELLKLDFSKLNEDFIKDNMNILYREITEKNVDEIVKKINLAGKKENEC